ncbi:MAG TPA: penicillin-binding protein 2 [Anaerolineales bacterium]|nr:penicillin-binding protein 2 [Anaerolineales bacterium]
MYRSSTEKEPAPIAGYRVWVFYVFIILGILVLSLRLFQLQILQYNDYLTQADRNRTFTVNIPAQRGVIMDRNGVLLAENIPQFNVTITPAFLPTEQTDVVNAIFSYISQKTGVPIDTPPLDAGEARGNQVGVKSPPPGIRDLVRVQDSLAPYTPVIVAVNIDREIALEISEKLRDLPGVNVEVLPARNYPTGELTAHIIGYQGPIPREQQQQYRDLGFDVTRDRIGYDGIEYQFQTVLAGTNGRKTIEQDVAGYEIRTIGEIVPAVPGANIRLTIDIRLQAAARAALRKMIDTENERRATQPGKYQITKGVVIAMSAKTGEILAMYSYPSYDNQQFAQFIPVEYYQQLADNPALPLLNQATQGEYAPGSVFKIVVAAGALQDNIITPEQTVFDPGLIEIRNAYYPTDLGKARKVVCWKRDGHGPVDFLTGLAQSCDIYFYALGGGYKKGGVDEGLGINKIQHYANLLGYNRSTGIELPAERDGLVPNTDWKRLNLGENWSSGDTYIASIGQGFILATPLQILNSYTPFFRGNNGNLLQPTLIHDISDGEGNILQPFVTRIIRNTPFRTDVLDWVDRGLRKVFIDGTGSVIAPPRTAVSFAGKSGTAEYCDNIAQSQNRCKFGAWPAHAWFVGYAPWEDPEIAVIAFVYSGEEGSKIAGPVTLDVIDAYFELKALDTGIPLPTPTAVPEEEGDN